jgi:hypothetical protein
VHNHQSELAEHYYLPMYLVVFRQGLYLAITSPEDIKRYSNSIVPIKMYLTRKHQTELNEVLNFNQEDFKRLFFI